MPSQNKGKSALVLSGGGITGAAYEIGALTALNRLFSSDFSTSDFDVYVGTSAGSIIATLMASCEQPGKIFQNALQIFRRYRLKQWNLSLREIIQIVQEQLPAGLYSLESMQSYFCRAFLEAGIKDDFGKLDASLCIIRLEIRPEALGKIFRTTAGPDSAAVII